MEYPEILHLWFFVLEVSIELVDSNSKIGILLSISLMIKLKEQVMLDIVGLSRVTNMVAFMI